VIFRLDFLRSAIDAILVRRDGHTPARDRMRRLQIRE